MRLHKIKLAGFKSFVDPTTIYFPSNRTGIIGPNGCGKSNVIDAVRWVMGESSAKQLRGDSMDDVIFNGSSSRAPVSRASIDLVFDNSEHTVGGQYANYNEISVRREVTREGQSSYFLNGTRCRRRDIADIFLGTGLGPRSYAIIEQGMISRIIEAKPEELRVYLEEAAGITKYKERRRETENRIRHTRENLERLDDLRDEVEKQLNHLKRQADTAEKYKKLKVEERQYKAELLALRWKQLDDKAQADQQALQGRETEVESVLAKQRNLELEIEQQREQQVAGNESFNTVQAEFYKLGGDISRIEQSIQHAKETRERQQQDLEQINTAWQELQEHFEEDQTKLKNVNQSIAEKQPLLETLQKNQQHSSQRFAEAEQAMSEWLQSWDEFTQHESEAQKTVQVEQTRIEQLEQHTQRLQERHTKLASEQQTLDTTQLQTDLEQHLADEARCSTEIEKTEQALQDANHKVHSAREQIQSLNDRLDDVRGEAQRTQGKLASLEALQEAALGKQDATVVEWLETQSLNNNPRLAENIQVQSGWELAAETVLGYCLEAVCVEKLDSITKSINQFSEGQLTVVENNPSSNPTTHKTTRHLLDKIEANTTVEPILAGVYAVETLDQALSMRSQLESHESVVTQDGVWVGPNWLRISRETAQEGSVLTREQDLKSCRHQLVGLQQQAETLENELKGGKELLEDQESQCETLREQLQTINKQLADCSSKVSSIKMQLEQLQKRKNHLDSELTDISHQIQQDQDAQIRSQKALQLSETKVNEHVALRQELQDQRAELKQNLQTTREHSQEDKDALHEIALNLESMRSMQDSTDRNLARMQQQLDQLNQRKQELQSTLSSSDQPIIDKESELEQLLKSRIQLEASVNQARAKVESIEEQIRQLDKERTEVVEQVQSLRDALEQAKLAVQETKVRSQTVKEQLDETGLDQQQLFAEMPEDASIDNWAEQVRKIEQRIQRMGAINLAAIDEHKEQSERKEYLDKQNADLIEALETLERAISKIDRETKARFKEVFELVNTHVQEMFPRLFGGGQAHLEMTGDDLLNTGIAIMARPPGKRISNIHLLSGGEKALTAVAMVFAIFQLNPAPFCMLDEVDAPLDEANVGRFGQMVKEMSEKVQFIVITHNKTTMEMVDQLTGVTMREAGVSRIVAVDVDEAVKMATG